MNILVECRSLFSCQTHDCEVARSVAQGKSCPPQVGRHSLLHCVHSKVHQSHTQLNGLLRCTSYSVIPCTGASAIPSLLPPARYRVSVTMHLERLLSLSNCLINAWCCSIQVTRRAPRKGSFERGGRVFTCRVNLFRGKISQHLEAEGGKEGARTARTAWTSRTSAAAVRAGCSQESVDVCGSRLPRPLQSATRVSPLEVTSPSRNYGNSRFGSWRRCLSKVVTCFSIWPPNAFHYLGPALKAIQWALTKSYRSHLRIFNSTHCQ